ncbi:MAG: hypothetical protein KGZ85_01545 [Ignavibacterium sp.]|nr:hypothetical protein [Ignavibacterium sp.]
MSKNFKDSKTRNTNLYFFLSGLLFDYSKLNAKGKKFYILHLFSAFTFFIVGFITIIVFLN